VKSLTCVCFRLRALEPTNKGNSQSLTTSTDTICCPHLSIPLEPVVCKVVKLLLVSGSRFIRPSAMAGYLACYYDVDTQKVGERIVTSDEQIAYLFHNVEDSTTKNYSFQ
jgi:hypothetical protein